jgi:hypothetical protein
MYTLDGLFLIALPFLFPLECDPYSACLARAFSVLPYSGGLLPILAGVLFLAAAYARAIIDEPPGVFASGLLALQASIIGLWFSVAKAPDLGKLLFAGPGSHARNASIAVPLLHLLALGATFIPPLFTAGWAMRDLLPKDTICALFRRSAAGCALLALLSMALYSFNDFTIGAILWFVLAVYAFAAFSPPRLHIAARLSAATISGLVIACAGLNLIAPDFSGFSYATSHHTELLIILFANFCLLVTTLAA